ncbi:hypothetical protein E3N88_18872 [Mikania micrantha]|uniref:Uncharacterized protein n=1 Tax=Mikania micrantha TaxID=192012 RepID=A0A5N6NLL5_9ASTR|nr:hypothetical protein E3N88_18872 [Mikania micrantha]
MVMKKDPVEVGEKEDREDPYLNCLNLQGVSEIASSKYTSSDETQPIPHYPRRSSVSSPSHRIGTIGWQVEAGRTSDEEGDNQQTQTQ